MKKNPLQGLGKKLNLHILIPVIYFGVMTLSLIVSYGGDSQVNYDFNHLDRQNIKNKALTITI